MSKLIKLQTEIILDTPALMLQVKKSELEWSSKQLTGLA